MAAKNVLHVIGGGVFDTTQTQWKRKRREEGEQPCSECKGDESRMMRCTPIVSNVGSSCEKHTVMINGTDFRQLIQRIVALERYVAEQELAKVHSQHHSDIPMELCKHVTQYL